jgi:RNA polymerase sigma-70 factor (ECF subfamily)
VSSPAGAVAGVAEDALLIGRLRDGDERAFEELAVSLYPAMLAVARSYVRLRAVADEVVQDAWVAVLKGLERFEGRSTLRTWVLQIVANIARDRGVRERRSLPFSALESTEEPLIEPDRFLQVGEPYPGGWRSLPDDWRTLPESKLLADETLAVVAGTLALLPDTQRLVITLRDMIGCSSEEVCDALGVSAGNERVLLHRARLRVRGALERYLDG